jgi:alpha-1,2-mannosyltransferase
LDPPRLAKTLGAAVLLWQPFVANTALGQVSLYTALGIVSSWRFLRRGQDSRAGLVLGALSVIKLFPLLFLVFFVVSRRWRAAATMIGVVLLGFGLTAFIVEPHTFLFYFQNIVADNRRIWGGYPLNASLHGASAMISGHQAGFWAAPVISPSAGAAVGVAASVVGVGVTAFCALVGRRVGEGAEAYAYRAMVVAMLLVSPLTWSHVFLVLLWPGAVLLRDRAALATSTQVLCAAAFLTFSLPQTTLAEWIIAHYLPRQVPPYAALVCMLPTGGLLIVWMVSCLRVRSAPTPS